MSARTAHKYIPNSASDERCMQVRSTGPWTSEICGEGAAAAVHPAHLQTSPLDRARTAATRLEQELAECRRLLVDLTEAVRWPSADSGHADQVEPAAEAAAAWLNDTPDGPPPVNDLIELVIQFGHHEGCVVWGGESYPGPCNCPVALAVGLSDVEAREAHYSEPEAGTR